jgi:hypothetical protein
MLSRLFGGIEVSEKPVQEQAPAAAEPQGVAPRALDVSFSADYPFPCLWDARDSDDEDEDDVITGSFDEEEEDQAGPLEPSKLRLSSVGPIHAKGPDGQELVGAHRSSPVVVLSHVCVLGWTPGGLMQKATSLDSSGSGLHPGRAWMEGTLQLKHKPIAAF